MGVLCTFIQWSILAYFSPLPEIWEGGGKKERAFQHMCMIVHIFDFSFDFQFTTASCTDLYPCSDIAKHYNQKVKNLP